MKLINYYKNINPTYLFFLEEHGHEGHGHEHHSIYGQGHTYHTTIKFFDVVPECCEKASATEVSVAGDSKYNQPCTEIEEVDREREKNRGGEGEREREIEREREREEKRE